MKVREKIYLKILDIMKIVEYYKCKEKYKSKDLKYAIRIFEGNECKEEKYRFKYL